MPEYQTDVNKIDWNGTLHAVRDALQNLRIGWECTQRALPADMHKQLVEESYIPMLEHLARFCAQVEMNIDIEENDVDVIQMIHPNP